MLYLIESVSTVIPVIIKFLKNVIIISKDEQICEGSEDGNITAKYNHLLVTCSQLIGTFCYELKGT